MLNKNVKFGIYAGIGIQAYFLLFYFIDKTWMLHPSVYWSSLAISIIFMARAAMNTKLEAGTLEWKEGIKSAFTVFITASVLFWVFYYALFQADPSLAEAQKEVQLNLMDQFAGLTGLSQDELKQAKESLEEINFSITLTDVIFQFARGVIGGFILSAFITFVVRRASKF